MLEHEQKNWNLSPKIRFLEILKLLPGKILQIWTNPSKIDPNVSVLYKGDVYWISKITDFFHEVI